MTESLLKTRNVFVDTEAYIHQRFRFDHPILRKLKDLGAARQLQVLATAAVVGEVRQHIDQDLNNAFKALGRFQTHAGMLEGAPADEFQSLFKRIEQSKFLEIGMQVWERFLADAKVEVVSASKVSAGDLLKSYFARKPPFSSEKKTEFPDAISLLSLEEWCQDKGSQLYLISDDPDLKAWCAERAGMHHVESLKTFLDLYNRAEEKLTQLALSLFEREERFFVSGIEESFSECTFVYDGDWDADVENVKITSTRVDGIDVIEVDEQHFILALEMEIRFEADISGTDYNDSRWDSPYQTQVSCGEMYDVSFEVIYDIETETVIEMKDVLFNDGTQIRIRDEHGYPHN
jgi:hypothetical protein